MFKFSFLNELFSLIHIVDKHISYHICKYIHLDLPSLFYISHIIKNTGSTSFDSLSCIHVYNFTECILLHQQCTTTTKATTNTSFSILNTTTKYIYRYIHWFSGTSIDFFMLSRLFMIQPSKILFDVDLYLNHASP